MAAKLEWGAKRTCLSCGARFYDMRREPITCPKCGTAFDPEAVFRPRRARSAPEPAAPKKPAPPKKKAVVEEPDEEPVDETADVEDVAAESDDEEDVIEDASDLAEDDTDLPPVPGPDEEET